LGLVLGQLTFKNRGVILGSRYTLFSNIKHKKSGMPPSKQPTEQVASKAEEKNLGFECLIFGNGRVTPFPGPNKKGLGNSFGTLNSHDVYYIPRLPNTW